MLIFSAVRGKKGQKKYYKDYKRAAVSVEKVLGYMRTHSISAFVYGEGVTETDPPEHCQGHRAARSIIEAGNALLIDIDNKYEQMSLERLQNRLGGYNYALVESMSSTEELRKFHIIVEVDRPFTTGGYRREYVAAIEWLGLKPYVDMSMKNAAQQLAPGNKETGFTRIGKSLPLDAALAASVGVDEDATAGGGHYTGYVAEGTTFTVSGSGESISIEEADRRVREHGKLRVHCAAGLVHGKTPDSAFISLNKAGETFYRCSGGRCEAEGSKKLINPLPALESAPVVTQLEPVGETVWSVNPRDFIDALCSDAYMPNATDAQREAAVARILKAILSHFRVRFFAQSLRVYNGKFWEELFPRRNMDYQFVQHVAIGAGLPVIAGLQGRVSSLVKGMISSVPVVAGQVHRDFINLQNCIVEVSRRGVRVLEHNPGAFFTSVLPYEYRPGAEAPVWERMVELLMQGDAELVKALQEAIGYLLLKDTNFEKAICFVGTGRNGKTQVNKAIQRMLGRENCSHLSLADLVHDNNYSRAKMEGRIVNITNELTPKELKADAFKDLISGENITARAIYSAPFTMQSVPKQLCAMNTTEGLIKESTEGFKRRLHLIPFDFHWTEDHYIDDLEARLDAEMPGVFNWCLEGARRVTERNSLFTAQKMVDLFESVVTDANPVKQFLEENWVVEHGFEGLEPGEKIKSCQNGNEIFEKYTDFCKINRYYTLGRNKFFAEMQNLGVRRIDSSVFLAGNVVKLKGFACRERLLN